MEIAGVSMRREMVDPMHLEYAKGSVPACSSCILQSVTRRIMIRSKQQEAGHTCVPPEEVYESSIGVRGKPAQARWSDGGPCATRVPASSDC